MSSMGFFPVTNEIKAKAPSAFDIDCAEQLIKAVKSHRKIMRPFKVSGWANQFRILRNEVTQDRKRIRRALKWYIRHFGEAYVPQAYSGLGFRQKFLHIEAAMARSVPVPKIKLTPETKDIVCRLENLHWRKGSDKLLPSVVSESLINYRAFLKDLHDFYQARDEDDRLGAIARMIDGRYLHAPPVFVEQWYIHINRSVRSWEEWSGKLKPWTRDNKEFQASCRSWSGRSDLWDRVMEKLR